MRNGNGKLSGTKAPRIYFQQKKNKQKIRSARRKSTIMYDEFDLFLYKLKIKNKIKKLY